MYTTQPPAIRCIIILYALNFVDFTDSHMSTSTHTHIHTHTHTHTHTQTCNVTEPSLTADTLSSILDSVQSLDDVGAWLQIPLSKREELQRQYDRRQLPRAYSTIFLTEVPSPSWSTVALALWENRELGALEIVQKSYLTGELCMDTLL